jgi:DNA (cytosine-5)-methyltransferase 1
LKNTLSYISLFSGGGLGCFGLQNQGFECIASSELLPRRMEVQKANNLVQNPNGYILGDITNSESQTKLYDVVKDWKEQSGNQDITLVVATPPCQGMSVANHKKKDEISRNSLVVESISIIKEIGPKFFLLENVRSFLKTECTDLDGARKTIGEAIEINLAAKYSITSRIINFKDFGADSSRTRTLVIGVRRDVTDVSPLLLFPDKKVPLTLAELIGDLPPLKTMGEVDKNDIYHSFKPYESRMRAWIQNLKPGESAFQNQSESLRPNRLVDGVKKANKEGNGDKYKRNYWDKVAPCVHTRNDILASQSTIHPVDDRVFSIRELSRMMGLSPDFKWSTFNLDELNSLPIDDKRHYLAQHEMNIRQCLGEGVPAQIFGSIGLKIAEHLAGVGSSSHIARHLAEFEKSNPNRDENSAFLTRLDIASVLVNSLPELKSKKTIRILEPSVGAGSFIPLIAAKYLDRNVELDVLDIDPLSLESARKLSSELGLEPNIKIRFMQADFLSFNPENRYDIIVGNPPFGKGIGSSSTSWTSKFECKDLFAKFLEHSLRLASHVSLIVPKTLLSGPEHSMIRKYISSLSIKAIHDFGEKAFGNIKIETIGLSVEIENSGSEQLKSISYPLGTFRFLNQQYICDKAFPTWLIYRNDFFDEVAARLDFGLFQVVRDREISSKHLDDKGSFKVIRASNIPRNGHPVAQPLFLKSDVLPQAAKSYLGIQGALVAPNLSYYPRAAKLENGQVVDGSAAVLLPLRKFGRRDISFFSSDVFFYFYRICRNYSTRSLNIDKLSVFYWGLPRSKNELKYDSAFIATSKMIYEQPSSLVTLQFNKSSSR